MAAATGQRRSGHHAEVARALAVAAAEHQRALTLPMVACHHLRQEFLLVEVLRRQPAGRESPVGNSLEAITIGHSRKTASGAHTKFRGAAAVAQRGSGHDGDVVVGGGVEAIERIAGSVGSAHGTAVADNREGAGGAAGAPSQRNRRGGDSRRVEVGHRVGARGTDTRDRPCESKTAIGSSAIGVKSNLHHTRGGRHVNEAGTRHMVHQQRGAVVNRQTVTAHLGDIVTRQVDGEACAGLNEHPAVEVVGVIVRGATVVIDGAATQHTGIEHDSIVVHHIHLRLCRKVNRRGEEARRQRRNEIFMLFLYHHNPFYNTLYQHPTRTARHYMEMQIYGNKNKKANFVSSSPFFCKKQAQ